jgi:hypothetical protein
MDSFSVSVISHRKWLGCDPIRVKLIVIQDFPRRDSAISRPSVQPFRKFPAEGLEFFRELINAAGSGSIAAMTAAKRTT